MKSTKGKVITLLVMIGILIIGIGIAILLSNNKDMIELSNQVAKVEEFKSNIDMTNVMSYYVDASNYTVENEKKAEIRYEYTDTTGDDKYDTCAVTIISNKYSFLANFVSANEWEVTDWWGPGQPIKSISKTYNTQIEEVVEISSADSIEIEPWRIGSGVLIYDVGKDEEVVQEYGTVSYEYRDTIGNGKWNACEIKVELEEDWYIVDESWENDDMNVYKKLFRYTESIINVDQPIFSMNSAESIQISIYKLGDTVTKLTMDSKATMIQGRSYQLEVEQKSLSNNNKTLRWSSSDESVAVINQYGVVTAKKTGTVAIKVEALINQQGAIENLEGGFEGGTATCTVNVTNDNSDEIYATQSTTNGNVKYEYMDTSGDMKYDKCRVTVLNVYLEELPIGWERIEETSSNIIYKDYGSNATEIIDVDPRDGWEDLIEIKVDQIGTQVDIKKETTIVEEPNVGYTVEYRYINLDENNPVWEYCIVTIKTSDIVPPNTADGWIRDLNQKTYTKIFVKDGREDVIFRHATITISIDQIGKYTIPVKNITLNKTEVDIKEGETTTLEATINPSNAVNKRISWSSSNSSAATVNANGVIKAVSVGETVIIAKAEGTNGEEVIAECEVTVLPKLTGIIVTQEPTKTEYTHYDQLDLSGLEVEAQYSDGSKQTITEGYTTNPQDRAQLTTAGTILVTVEYQGERDEFEINVDPSLTGIKITNPDKMAYKKGEKLDLAGLKVEAVYSDKTTQPITDKCKINVKDGESLTEVGNKTITIRYEGMEKSFEESFFITVTEEPVNPTLNKIEITESPKKTEYKKGAKLDLTGLKVEAVYSDGARTKISEEDYTTTPENGTTLEQEGKVVVKVEYEEKSTEFEVTVKEDKNEGGEGNQGGSGNQDGNGNENENGNGNGSQGSTETTSSSKVTNNGKETNANTAPKILPKTGIGETIRMYAIAFSIVMTIIGIIVICSYVRYRKTPRE